ncbi:MAG: TonB-dependent receptor [Acidobacteriaceae bacterium]|nr:TonB-dependent receptor [Acidobacteriaceae bacterium]
MTWSSIRFVVLLFLVCTCAVRAQISNATLEGIVTDASGGVVSGATVTAINLGTQVTRAVVTGSNGEYTIPDLPIAHYSITVTSAGFKTYNVPDVELQVAQRVTVNATLQVGDVQQQVTVGAVAPIIETSQSSVGQVVNPTTVERMPLNGRSFWQLTSLTPGVTYTPGGQGTRTGGSSIRSSSVNVTINGTAPNQTGWFLDGAFITEMQTGGTLIQPNVDALQEFKVESSNMSAEYGHTPNVVNVSSKSGTNGFHGTGFEFIRNSVFDAKNFFYVPPVGSNQGIEPLRRNQYGFAVGGPIRRDKVFFFGDFEKTGLLQGVDFNNVVPSLVQRGGNFSQLSKRLLNPANRYQPYAGNVIPVSSFSPQALYFLQYMPTPNTTQGSASYSALTNNLLQNQMRGDGRVDAQISIATQLTGRYSINNNDENDPNPYLTMGSFPLHSRAQNATISLTHIFSPKLLNEARVSYYRSYFYFGGTLQGTNFNQLAGVQGFDDTTPVYSFPQVTLTGYSNFTGSPSDQRPKQNRIRNLQYADNVSYTVGGHSIKLGAELLHQTAAFINGSSSVGTFNFVGTYTGDAFADFLLGYPDNVTRDYFKQLNGDYQSFWGFYVQDNFRVTPNFTWDLGVRLDLNGFYNGIRGQKSAFDLTNGKLIIPSSIDPNVQPLTPTLLNLFSDRFSYTKSLGLPDSIQPVQKNWAPRVGFAWTPLGGTKFAIRSGFGIFYGFPDSNTINNTVATVPFVAATTVTNDRPPRAPTRTWGNYFLGQPNVTANTSSAVCSFGYVALSCATPNVNSGAIVFRSQAISEWNFAVQRQLTASTSIDVAYVGNKTTHLNQSWSINDPVPGPGQIQARRPYAQWGTISYPVFSENANYNALQIKYESRSWHGLNTLVSYAWSKCIDSGSLQGGTTLLLLRANRGPCDYDLPQTFTGSFDYVLPLGRGKQFLSGANRFINELVGGWEATGIVTLRSGIPFTPIVNGDIANTGVSNQRPQVIGSPVYVEQPSCWFYVAANSACTALAPQGVSAFATPATYTYGNGGRNILRADSIKQVDFSLLKTFPFDEVRRLQLRAEVFNILNHPTFSAPSPLLTVRRAGRSDPP